METMKRICLLALLLPVLQGCAPAAPKPVALETDVQKNGYSVGYDIGRNLKKQPLDMDADAVVRGLSDGYKGTAAAMTDEDMTKQINGLRMEAQRRVMEQRKQAGEQSLKEGEAFLAKNKAEPGVTTTASGLQYKVIKAGKGKKPTAKDTVSVHYRGTLINGTEFDSSHKRGQPATFPVAGVIPGWTEALQLMPVGSTWTLYIPSKLAYAENGSGSQIGPNATLIFEVELLSINKPGS
jgi:FKBP-type peptidyl-prolyl cis-trans isomerase FklB